MSLFIWPALLCQASKGHWVSFYGTRETLLGRGSHRGRWLAMLRAWVKRLRCTNKTATHTNSRDAYRPLRGCLTAGDVAFAGHILSRLHYSTYYTLSFYSLFTKITKLPHIFICQGLLFGALQTKGPCQGFFKVAVKMGRKMRSLTNNSLYLSLPLPSIFFLAPVSLFCSSWVMS